MFQVNLLLALIALLAIQGVTASLHNDGRQAILGSQPKSANDAHQVLKELKKAEIIPTVIDAFFPSLIVDAQWSSHNYAALGNTLKPKKLQDAPSIRLTQPGASSGSCTPLADTTYTVAITDPDAPSREDPKWSEFCHWIATAVPVSRAYTASTCSHIELSGLQEVMPYKPPGPPEKTGKHRYVFLVFVPANGTAEPLSLTKPEDRQHWGYDYHGDRVGVRKWAAENGLVPVAANFIYAQNKQQ